MNPEERCSPTKLVYSQTWGCQMNEADTQRMLARLAQANYSPTSEAAEADLILLNTCHIREKARHKVVSRLGELLPHKTHNPDLIIAVAGCVAQGEGKSSPRSGLKSISSSARTTLMPFLTFWFACRNGARTEAADRCSKPSSHASRSSPFPLT